MARAIYLGSAPTATAAHRGLEDRWVKLGCVMPGESPAVFGDTLRRLAGAATYLYQDGPRYWYSTQPTVTKLAEDRAEQLKRDSDKVVQEIGQRLRADLRQAGDFSRIHPLPQSSGQDVPDDLDARLVVLGLDHPYTKEAGNAAEVAARAILETRGSAHRLFRNTLGFLAADKTRLQDLDEAARRYLAWESILLEKEVLDLSPHQVRQAETQKSAAVRASKKLRSEELPITGFAPTRLRMELDRIPLWRGNHVPVKQLVEDFARYLHLPRLRDASVLLGAVRDGLSLLTWEQDAFAYADTYDEGGGRYRGLRFGQHVAVTEDDSGLLVQPAVARRQQEAEVPDRGEKEPDGTSTETDDERTPPEPDPSPSGTTAAAAPLPRRFHGTVELDATRVGRDASRIADEVLSHLSGLVGARVKVTLEIEAEIPSGAPAQVVRTVTENGRTLRFTSQGFEVE